MSRTVTQRIAPKYLQVADELRSRITSGALRSGERLPSYSEVRARGISQPTLDRVHSILERDGLIEKRHGSGVFVAGQTGQHKKRHGVLGLVGLDNESWQHPYWARLLSGVQGAAHAQELDILLLGGQSPLRWERVDGILIAGYNGAALAKQRSEGLPTIGLMIQGSRGFRGVTRDDEGAALLATEYLIGLVHRRIAYLGNHPIERRAGYQKALQGAGIAADTNWIRQYSIGEKRPGWLLPLGGPTRPDAELADRLRKAAA